MARIEIDPDAEAGALAGWHELAATRLGPQIRDDAKRYAPVRTGALRDSIENHMEGNSLIIEAHAPYAAWVELGTRPHLIQAHGPYSLHNEETGEYFGREVHHPGTRPQSYLRAALYQQRSE